MQSPSNVKTIRSSTIYCLLFFSQFLYTTPVHADPQTSLSTLAAPCLACHSVTAESATHIGPSLSGVAGRKIGADQNFTYSEALTAKALEGGIWDRTTLDSFLKKPQAVIEGTAMSYPGVPDEHDRKILLDWLFSDSSGSVANVENANFLHVPDVRKVLEYPVDIAYGEYLAGECLTCHQADTADGQVPPIHKLTKDYFVYALLEYQNGARSNRVMQTVAGALGEEEMAALSAVFSQR